MHISCSSAHHDFDRSVVAEIHEEVKKRSGRHKVSRFFRSSDDKDAIVAWNSELGRILQVFNVRSARSRFVLPSLITLLPG